MSAAIHCHVGIIVLREGSVVGVDCILAGREAGGVCRCLAGEDVETFGVGWFGSGVLDLSLFAAEVGEHGHGAALGCA